MSEQNPTTSDIGELAIRALVRMRGMGRAAAAAFLSRLGPAEVELVAQCETGTQLQAALDVIEDYRSGTQLQQQA